MHHPYVNKIKFIVALLWFCCSLPATRSFTIKRTISRITSQRYDYHHYDHNHNHQHAQYLPSSSSSSSTTATSLCMATQKRSSSSTTAAATATIKKSKEQQEQQQQEEQRKKKKKKSKSNNQKTGGLRRLPVVRSPIELADKARKNASYIKPNSDMQNARNRARKHSTQSLNELTQLLCIPLRDIVKGYKREWKQLHPFERVIADLTARARQRKDGLTLTDVLDDINESRKTILDTGKDWMAKAKYAETAREADETLSEGTERLVALFEDLAYEPVSGIIGLQKALRSAPTIELDTPAVVLVGAPNVGKSSIVCKISSGTPEINNYPFTTRGMTLGHVEVFWSEKEGGGSEKISNNNDDDDNNNNTDEDSNQDNDDETTITKAAVPAKAIVPSTTVTSKGKTVFTKKKKNKKKFSPDDMMSLERQDKYAFSQLCQIMDTPGLSIRNEDDRNEMELLTLASMQHLPTAVMFVMDFSGQAGDKFSSVQDQLQLRKEMRERFPRRPWIDVISKVDLGIVDGSEEQLKEIMESNENDTKYIKLSSQDGTGVKELQFEVLKMLGEVRIVLDAISAATTANDDDQQVK